MKDGEPIDDALTPAEPHDAGVLPVADGREAAPVQEPASGRESAPLPVDALTAMTVEAVSTPPAVVGAGSADAVAEPLAETVAVPAAGSAPADAMNGEDGGVPADIAAAAESPPIIESIDASELRAAGSPAAEASSDEAPDATDLPPAELRAIIESLLLVATRPLSTARLASCLPGSNEGYLDGFLRGLAARFDHENRGWELRFIANGWQLLTRRTYHPWVRQLERRELPTKLSRSALETLAIVAYRQPIARGTIEDIRGVQCGPVLRQLMDLRLVQVVGREEHTLGRPLLYGTTDHFLQRFGLGRIADLPRRHEFGA